jgi:hypothetical protein
LQHQQHQNKVMRKFYTDYKTALIYIIELNSIKEIVFKQFINNINFNLNYSSYINTIFELTREQLQLEN